LRRIEVIEEHNIGEQNPEAVNTGKRETQRWRRKEVRQES